MSNVIELNEEQLRSVIKEAVNKVLNEANYGNTNSRGETIELSPNFQYALDDLEMMQDRLKGFISEYSIVVKSLLDNAQKLGLILKDFSTEKYFDIESALNGQVYEFSFEFSVPKVDVNKMSDDEYEEFERNLNIINDKLEYEVVKPSYGAFRMYTTEDGIQVYYEFKLSNGNN